MPYSDLGAAEVWFDANGNGTFDSGTDRLFGTGSFGVGETVAVTGSETYAAGAVTSAKWLEGRKPGLYGMKDVLGL